MRPGPSTDGKSKEGGVRARLSNSTSECGAFKGMPAAALGGRHGQKRSFYPFPPIHAGSYRITVRVPHNIPRKDILISQPCLTKPTLHGNTFFTQRQVSSILVVVVNSC